MANQKMKTKRAAAKRFKVTGTGKLKRNKAYKSHILTKKTTKRKRNLRKSALVDETNVKTMKKIMGYRGARSKQYRVAKQSVMRALEESYTGRKQKKRQFRQLWIARINAAARMNGLSYSKFMYGLKLAEVNVNRKMLSEMAISDPEGFASLVEVAKSKLA